MRTGAASQHDFGPSDSRLTAELSALDWALDVGDLVAARDRARAIRRAIESPEETPARHERRHLRLVEGGPLTRRELATLRFLTDGSMSQKDIAREMGVTPNTVKTHLKSLYLKLDAHCRGEAIERARELGILRRLSHDASGTHPTAHRSFDGTLR